MSDLWKHNILHCVPTALTHFQVLLCAAFLFPVFLLFSFLSLFPLRPSQLSLDFSPTPFPLCHILSLTRFSFSLTGAEKRFELSPVAAVSVHLLASDGVELQVNEPITVSIPLPADSGLKENDHIPAWRFDPRLGTY